MVILAAGCVMAQEAEDLSEAEAVSEGGESSFMEREAIYLGVENYGAPETNKESKPDFRYRFLIEGEEVVLSIDNGTMDEEGEYDYPIQNALKEGYAYRITTEGDTVEAVQELPWDEPEFTPVVAGTPGEKTLTNFLKTAMMPVGTTLYIYGGGWDWQDVGSSVQARTLGVSPDWVRFFEENDESFTFKGVDGDEEHVDPTTSYYPYGEYNEYYYAGLDCSGYVGWVIYNTFETEDGKDGYVVPAVAMSKMMEDFGWGTWEHKLADRVMKPGDIMSMNGHVWISLGTCDDGSVVIAHGTPSDSRTNQPGGGVQLSAVGESEECEAYKLADTYMSRYYPEWYERYPAVVRDPEVYFEYTSDKAGRFTWDTTAEAGLADPDGLQEKKPAEVLALLFGE